MVVLIRTKDMLKTFRNPRGNVSSHLMQVSLDVPISDMPISLDCTGEVELTSLWPWLLVNRQRSLTFKSVAPHHET